VNVGEALLPVSIGDYEENEVVSENKNGDDRRKETGVRRNELLKLISKLDRTIDRDPAECDAMLFRVFEEIRHDAFQRQGHTVPVTGAASVLTGRLGSASLEPLQISKTLRHRDRSKAALVKRRRHGLIENIAPVLKDTSDYKIVHGHHDHGIPRVNGPSA
jgi:hypothetical protein